MECLSAIEAAAKAWEGQISSNCPDGILALYHDQGLIPFKILNFFEGVNYTGGLNIIRSSPCHGTAYDLVGKKGTKYNSLLNSILLINKVYKNRKNAKKISRSKFFN